MTYQSVQSGERGVSRFQIAPGAVRFFQILLLYTSIDEEI